MYLILKRCFFVLSLLLLTSCGSENAYQVWQPLTLSWQGPTANETDAAPNPFLDYRLQVTFTGPSEQSYNVPGFFAGDGNGGSEGNTWRVQFTPDEVGRWRYSVSFREGSEVAIDLSSDAGSATAFDGTEGSFTVAESDNAPGFLKWGRLEYADSYYLKFRDGSYFIKTGTDSPEDFLAYSGFDDTKAQHDYAEHQQDWNTGDPDWNNGQGKGIIGALNYLAQQRVNSIYFLPMNIGGDGKNTWPFAGDIDPEGDPKNNNLHYDISKLDQWEIVLAHAQRQGILLHVVLTEGETTNKKELDDGELGVERKLYYRELIARFTHHNALVWNISEEYDIEFDLGAERVKSFAEYIQAVDPYDHPITVHNYRLPDTAWEPFLGDERFSLTSFQYDRDSTGLEHEVETWLEKSREAGHPLAINLDEFRRTTPDNLEAQRKEFLWPILLSSGQLEYIIERTEQMDDFRPYEDLWNWSWYARKFMEENLPFWEMLPDDDLLSEASEQLGGGQVFVKEGEVYAVYLPRANETGILDLSAASGELEQRWYDPRTGEFEGDAITLFGGDKVALGEPPRDRDEDWVILIVRK